MHSSSKLALALLAPALCRAADTVDNFHGWYNYFGKFGLGSGWSWWTELQARRNDGIVNTQQYLVRTSILKQVSPALEIGGGYGFIRTDPYGKAPVATTFDENRIFQDVFWNHSRQRWSFQHRFRWEERQSMLRAGTIWTQRFRYRLMMRRPFGSSKNWYWTASNEIMFNVPPNKASRAFDQNRLIALAGRNLSSGWRVEFGFLEQALLRRNGRILENNHTFMLQLFAPNWKFRK
jgi:hypothetical protein